MASSTRSTAHFKATELKRAIKSVEDCGLEIGQVSIAPDGTINIITQTGMDTAKNIWDQEYGEAAH